MCRKSSSKRAVKERLQTCRKSGSKRAVKAALFTGSNKERCSSAKDHQLVTSVSQERKSKVALHFTTVRSGAEERTFSRARVDVLNFRLCSYHVSTYIADGNRQKSHKKMTFSVQAGTFLCFQAGRSSAMRSSASDPTVDFLAWVSIPFRAPCCRRAAKLVKDTTVIYYGLISYFSYFRLKVRNLVAFENHARITVYVAPSSLYENL